MLLTRRIELDYFAILPCSTAPDLSRLRIRRALTIYPKSLPVYMPQTAVNPILRPLSILLIALSLSIGWGIRGNFGHEAGAMIAGSLSALAVAIVSGREDWRRRVLYFGLFGGLGWGFGGSIAYMYPISFTESGHAATTYYGYFALFLEGGLWCGMGAAGTAFAAAMPIGRLKRFFTPLCFVLAAMGLRHYFEEPLEQYLAAVGSDTGDQTWHRHKSPLYRFDADWLQAVTALAGVCIYELLDRFRQTRTRWIDNPIAVVPFAGAGAAAGYAIQAILRKTGWEQTVADLFVIRLGDLDYVNPETGGTFAPDQLLTNWPQFFSDYASHLGIGFGLVAGLAIYFLLTSRWRNDSSLLLYLALGWLIAFIAMPTLGSLFLMDYGGLRVMPPRSDDWAGITGVFVAGLVWSLRHEVPAVAQVMSRGFIYGGISFASVPMIRYLIRYPVHPWRHPDGVPEGWTHFNSANWHSVLEQMHGFGHGLAIAFVMAMLWRRLPTDPTEPNDRRWTHGFAGVFVLFGIGFLNLHKLVRTWIEKESIPATLKAPFFEIVEATPHVWFRVVWYTVTAVAAILMLRHLRRRLDLIPSTGVGKGQLLYLSFLWMMVVGNLIRAIPGFSDGRMVTEWVLFMNACLATLLVLVLPRDSLAVETWNKCASWPSLRWTWLRGLTLVAVLMSSYGFVTLTLYQEHIEGKPWANHRRFGPDATWRTKPILKHGNHP